MRRLRNSRLFRSFAVFLTFTMFWQVIHPAVAYGLTSGPSQPEMAGFEPIGTTDMVDLFTGDFKYNIPLLDVGGYPINMVYNSGVTMDQEASWVGLGWSLNPGAINRNLRGVPDDFNGDMVVEEVHMKDNVTYGLTVGTTAQLAGIEALSVSGNFGVNYNTHRGLGLDVSFKPSLAAGMLNISADFNASSQSGISISPGLSYSTILNKKEGTEGVLASNGTLGFSASYNTRAGLSQVSYKASLQNDFNKVKSIAGSKEAGLLNQSTGISTGASITYGPSYFPVSKYSMNNTNVRFHATIGGEILPFHGGLQFSGFMSTQSLKRNKFTRRAYGYHYLSNQAINKNSILDYNTEKDGGFSEHSKHVYLAGHTMDQFSVTGQGLVGSFKGHRNDVGYGFDPGTQNTSNSITIGGEVGGGNTVHGGGSIVHSATNSSSGNWSDDNDAAVQLERVIREQISNDLEKASFQDVVYKFNGELHKKEDLYSGWGDYEPVTLDIKKVSDFEVKLKNKYSEDGNDHHDIEKNYHAERSGLKKNVQILTAREAKIYGFEKSIPSYTMSTIKSGGLPSLVDRVEKYRKGNHFSEIRVTDEQGWTYVYGIPAYNTKQYEVTFNTEAFGSCVNGLVNYNEGENSVEGAVGIDEYYSKKSIPPYAYSFLLTAVLPPDYRDLDNDGISEIDLGNPVEFLYDLTSTPYKWRTPMGGNIDDELEAIDRQANFNPGYNSKTNDNKANYVYGEKEQWYLQAIRSKTHIALFHTSIRTDAHGAVGENGGISPSETKQKLDSIQLFSRADFENAIEEISSYGGTLEDYAVPIKTVHFDYYEEDLLCPNTPNSNGPSGGKLTLKNVYFTYGKSRKAKLNKYEFIYYGFDEQGGSYPSGYNPNYNLRGSDRWGTYKPNTTGCSLSDDMSNIDFPYTLQGKELSSGDPGYDSEDANRTKSDHYASIWNLAEIKLPSGGSIKVSYEADDYAYVQNKKAMQMFEVIDIGSSSTLPGSTGGILDLYDKNANLVTNTLNTNEYVFFNIDAQKHGSLSENELRYRYTQGIDTLYFKMYMNIVDKNEDPNYEYVTGYAPVESVGFIQEGEVYSYGYLKLEKIGIKDKNKGQKISPLLKTGLQYSRIHMNDLVYPGSNPNGSGESTFMGMVSLLRDVKSIFTGFNRMLIDREFCDHVYGPRSFIRLNNPYLAKEGGGARVKSIKINDNWEEMVGSSNGSSFEYGQEYDYTLTREIDGQDVEVSSGVASYEPMIGNDENPFRMPVAVTIEHAMAPDETNYIEKPFGEMFYPSPSVGYSKVTVRNLQYEDVKRTATGWTVHRFHTAQDFPTRVTYTQMQKEFRKMSSLAKFFAKKDRKLLAASQGYSIILNDMHGRQESMFMYSESGVRISGTEYKYKVDPNDPRKLDNTVTLIKPGTNDMEQQEQEFGVEVDIINHFKSNDLSIHEEDVQANFDGFVVVVPIPLPSLFMPNINSEHLYRLASTTKVIHQHGLVEEVIAHDFGSSISTKNLAYDYYTGEVLVTQTFNEYEDPVYNMTYPGYWAYSGLGSSSLNINYTVDDWSASTTGTGVVDVGNTTIAGNFEVGDQVMVYSENGVIQYEPYWLLEKSGTNLTFVDRFGQELEGNGKKLRVWKSGKVNTPTIPIQTITSTTNPLTTAFSNGGLAASEMGVINSEASTFCDYWQMHTYNCTTAYDRCSCDTNTVLIRDIELFFNDLAANGEMFHEDNDDLNGSPLTLSGYASLTSEIQEYMDPGPYTWSHLISSLDYTIAETFINSSTEPPCGFTFTMYDIPLGLSPDPTNENVWPNLREITIIGPEVDAQNCNPNNYELKAIGKFEFRTTSLITPGEGEPVFDYETEVYEIPITIKSDEFSCHPFVECSEITGTIGDVDPGEIINPYLYGVLGNWQKKQSFTYQGKRSYAQNDIRHDGIFSTYDLFWEVSGGKLVAGTQDDWISPSKVTLRSPHGFEVENEDILGLYSSARFGYSKTLPTDISQNARYREAGFESFEDISFLGDDCIPRHLGFTPSGSSEDHTSDFAHTGTYSLEVEASGNATYSVEVQIPNCPDQVTPSIPYTVNHCDMLPPFMPGSKSESKEYVLSIWYYYDQTGQVPNYDQPTISVDYDGNPCTAEVLFVSPVIERWQKVDFLIQIPIVADGKDIDISINNSSSTEVMYLDDIRAFPFNGTMKSYVYDPVSLRLVAELDENNYATFYEYDKEGILIRIKKETERGIMTIQETRQHKSF